MTRELRIIRIWYYGKLKCAKNMKWYQFGIDFYFSQTGRYPKGKFYIYKNQPTNAHK